MLVVKQQPVITKWQLHSGHNAISHNELWHAINWQVDSNYVIQPINDCNTTSWEIFMSLWSATK